MIRHTRRFAPLLLVLAAGCEPDPLAPLARDVAVTASLVPAATYTIAFEVRNAGRRTVYAAACDDRIAWAVQPRAAWGDGDPVVFCSGSTLPVPVAIQPGATARGEARAPGPGEYRVAVVLRASQDARRRQQVAFSGGVVVPAP